MHKGQKGQVVVIFAIVVTVLLLFIGLALDAGGVYVAYGQLKRTVDSASLAAANEFKRSRNVADMTTAAGEVLSLMGVDYTTLQVLVCDEDMDGVRDAGLPPEFELICPDTASGDSPQKLVYVRASTDAPLNFLSLLGFGTLTLSTYTVSEAAPLDVVIVLDTSESMASDTPGYSPHAPYDPTGCNTAADDAQKCQPMLDTKNAAKALIDTLTSGYDMVSVVTFDRTDHVIFSLGLDMDAAKAAIDSIQVHDDPPVVFNIWSDWYNHPGVYNPLNTEDLDGDGLDADPALPYTCPFTADPATDPPYLQDRWWSVAEGGPDPYGWGGVPCDRDDRYDSMDWNGDGIWTQEDHDLAVASKWANSSLDYKFSGLSTCSGCGIRQGVNQLRGNGRFNSVWVMVFLSDGGVNLSDLHESSNVIPVDMVNGACGGTPGGNPFWDSLCFDNNPTPRYCIDDDASTCPPGSIHTTTSPPYSVLDYALDMADEASLQRSSNTLEPLGNDLAIYTIRLGSMSSGSPEHLLRYLAAVGDDGDRNTDACASTPANRSCGQYYFAPSSSHLMPIFEDIASRIYIKISQ